MTSPSRCPRTATPSRHESRSDSCVKDPCHHVRPSLGRARPAHVVFNGRHLEPDERHLRQPDRLWLPPLAADNVLVVEAEFAHVPAPAPEGVAGLFRAVTPAGETVMFSQASPGGPRTRNCRFGTTPYCVPHSPSRWTRRPAGRAGRTVRSVPRRPGGGAAGVRPDRADRPVRVAPRGQPRRRHRGRVDLAGTTRADHVGRGALGRPAGAAASTPGDGGAAALGRCCFGTSFPYGTDVVFVPHHPKWRSARRDC